MERVNIRDRDQWFELAQRARYRSVTLASLLSISPRQLHRYTRKVFGRSPQAWLDEQRLWMAAGLLRRWRSVKVVAYELGFKQVSHFSREFKLRFGISPARFVAWSDEQGAERPRRTTDGSPG